MTRTDAARTLGAAGIVFGFALALRLSGAKQELSADEIYHVLAARQLLLDGTMQIHGGVPYERGAAFTHAVALVFRAIGESPAAARMPALLCGALLPACLFLWLRALGLGTAAWLAALFSAADTELVRVSGMCRFYAPQNLLFLLGAIGIERALRNDARAPVRIAWGVASAGALLAADSLQEVTRIGAGALALWSAGALALLVHRRVPARRARGAIALAAALALLALGIVAVRSGVVGDLLATSQYVDWWARGAATNPRWYHGLLVDAWPSAWSLLPLVALVALCAAARPASLAASVLGLGIAIHSQMAFKQMRFVSYLMPFLWMLAGIAAASAWPGFVRGAHRALARLPALASRPIALDASARALCLLACLACVPLQSGWMRTLRLALADSSWRDSITTQGTLSWRRAARDLEAVVRDADVLLTSDDLKSLYYLGRADYVLIADHLRENLPLDAAPRPEFTHDAKIALPLVSRPESLARIMACFEHGLFVGQTGFLDADWIVPADTRDWLLAHTDEIPLPTHYGVTARRWRTPTPPSSSERCPPRAD